MIATRLAIVGGGPNALYLVERLYAHVRKSPSRGEGLSVDVFDSGGHFGSGCHYRSQPATNHLNRAADQISFGADETNLPDVTWLLDRTERWTLYEWCQTKYAQTGDERYRVEPGDWVERRLFGEVSEDVFAIYVDRLRRLDVTVTLHTCGVDDIEQLARGEYRLHGCAAGLAFTCEADFVALCTGHGETTIEPGSPAAVLRQHADRHAGTHYIHNIYPTERIDLTAVPAGCTVLCQGMGLAAIDFALLVTEGRGGRFVAGRGPDGKVSYLPSGLEPAAILPFSSTGVFLFTRAHNQKMNDRALFHQGVFFVPSTIDRLRETVGVPCDIPNVGVVRQIDFGSHVLPIMRLEMALVYYGRLLGPAWTATAIHAVTPRVRSFILEAGPWHERVDAAMELLTGPIDALARAAGEPAFDWDAIADPLAGVADSLPSARHDRATAFLWQDIVRAREGNLDNPLKRAIDGVWRDLRDVVRYAVEYGGLTATSHRQFIDVYARLTNRIAVGTSLGIMVKIHALAACGLIDLSWSRAPRVTPHAAGGYSIGPEQDPAAPIASVFVDARVHRFHVTRMRDPLYPNLHRRGLVRQWVNPGDGANGYATGGIDVQRGTNLVVGGDGAVCPSMAALGPPTEGPLYFHLAAMRPYCADPVIVDADRVVRQFLSRPRRPAGDPAAPLAADAALRPG